MLDQSTRRVYVSRIADISVEDLKFAPTRQMGPAGGELPTQQDASGAARLLNTSYQATVPIQPDGLLRVGLVGQARVQIRHRTLGERLWRYLTRTFNFEL